MSHNVEELIKHLDLSHINYEMNAMNETTLKNVHIYCVINNISAQKYGLIIEKYIIKNCNYLKNKSSECIGDCRDPLSTGNIEIKTSLGGIHHNKFNYVQIRISQEVDTYIFTAYYLTKENVMVEGELFVFKLSKEDVKRLLLKYGGYAHGTVKKLGKISMDQLNSDKNDIEYSLRPSYGDNCWKDLQYFRID
jgi:hypothetical protein